MWGRDLLFTLMYLYKKQFYVNVKTSPNTTSVQSKFMPHALTPFYYHPHKGLGLPNVLLLL